MNGKFSAMFADDADFSELLCWHMTKGGLVLTDHDDIAGLDDTHRTVVTRADRQAVDHHVYGAGRHQPVWVIGSLARELVDDRKCQKVVRVVTADDAATDALLSNLGFTVFSSTPIEGVTITVYQR